MPDRSVSLPLFGGGKSTATGWKEKGVMHTKEKEREIEASILQGWQLKLCNLVFKTKRVSQK